MTELEALQAKRREEAARKRANLKERKARTRRLIQRGAIFWNLTKKKYLIISQMMILSRLFTLLSNPRK